MVEFRVDRKRRAFLVKGNARLFHPSQWTVEPLDITLPSIRETILTERQPAQTDQKSRCEGGGDAVDVDQIIELVGNMPVLELFFDLYDPDMAEFRLVDPFEGLGLLFAHPPQVEQENRFAELMKQVLQGAGIGGLSVMLPFLWFVGCNSRVAPLWKVNPTLT